MTTSELAKIYDVTERTIRSWRKKQAPFDNPLAMNQWIAAQRSRFGVGKRFSKLPVVAQPSDESDSAEFQSHAELADFLTAMSGDLDHICALIAAAGPSLQAASPEVYKAFQPLLELCEKWSRNLNV
jgi:hypothetical protein